MVTDLMDLTLTSSQNHSGKTTKLGNNHPEFQTKDSEEDTYDQGLAEETTKRLVGKREMQKGLPSHPHGQQLNLWRDSSVVGGSL